MSKSLILEKYKSLNPSQRTTFLTSIFSSLLIEYYPVVKPYISPTSKHPSDGTLGALQISQILLNYFSDFSKKNPNQKIIDSIEFLTNNLNPVQTKEIDNMLSAHPDLKFTHLHKFNLEFFTKTITAFPKAHTAMLHNMAPKIIDENEFNKINQLITTLNPSTQAVMTIYLYSALVYFKKQKSIYSDQFLTTMRENFAKFIFEKNINTHIDNYVPQFADQQIRVWPLTNQSTDEQPRQKFITFIHGLTKTLHHDHLNQLLSATIGNKIEPSKRRKKL